MKNSSNYLVGFVCIIILQCARGDFHCRRKGFSCRNGGICTVDGSCTCPSTHIGFDCSVEASLVGCSDNPCENSGTCYDKGKCFCSPDYYGDKCQYKAVSSECLGSELKMAFVVQDAFSGDVYVSQDEVNCKFNPTAAEVTGMKKYSLTISFNSEGICSKTVNKTEDDPQDGDISRSVDVVISYNPMFISSTDSIIIYRCIHKGSNFTMFAALDDVGLNERTNLKKDVLSGTYLPVRFAVMNRDGLPLEKPLFVGDIFKLLFFLSDTNVYETLLIDYCIANNTMSQTPVQFEFIKNGCPTNDGKNIMANQEGPISSKYSRPGTAEQLPASELLMYAFKFKGTTNVGFNCAVRICKKGDESLCKARKCTTPVEALIGDDEDSDDELPSLVVNSTGVANSTNITTVGVTRRKRASGDRQLLSTVVTVQEPALEELLILPNIGRARIDQGENKTADPVQCVMSQGIIVAIIVMATLIFSLIVISTILTVTMCKTRRRIQLLREKHTSDCNYTIPRPKFIDK